QLHLVISTEDKENYLKHPIPEARAAPPGQQVPPAAATSYAAWVKGQKEVTVLMLLTMDLDIQRNLAHLGAYDMLQELKAMFSEQAEQELRQTVIMLRACLVSFYASGPKSDQAYLNYVDQARTYKNRQRSDRCMKFAMDDYLSRKHFGIKEFLREKKISRPSFIDWYRQLHLVISTEDKKNYLKHPIPEARAAPPGQQVPPAAATAYAAWVKGQKEVTVLMLLTKDLDIQRNLAHLGAYDMIQELKAMFSEQAEQELRQTVS
nr:zinc finger, CCHC-type [Tanacetum cinerariifolium]